MIWYKALYPVKGCCLPGVSRGSLGGGRYSKVSFHSPRPLNNPNPFGLGLRIVIIQLRTSVPHVLVSPPPGTWRAKPSRFGKLGASPGSFRTPHVSRRRD